MEIEVERGKAERNREIGGLRVRKENEERERERV
jgi:hypothetical protein